MSFALAPGEILGIGGANGAGKSTLLAAIAGSARIFAGSVERRPGLRLAHQRQLPPAFAGVPFNGHDLLALTGASSAGLPPWLASRLALRLDTLSGGQRQFLHLWASLQAPADLVMLDEPTNNLDPAGVAALEVALRRRAADGVGLLLVSHDARFIAAVCGRVLQLDAPPDDEFDCDSGNEAGTSATASVSLEERR
nr:ABC transporter ATP-binding protein [Rhodocyclus tenuis]